MNIFEAIYIYLMTKTALTTLIGTGLFFEQSPENQTYPYINFSCHDVERVVHLGNSSAYGEFFVSFDIYAATTYQRFNIGNALRNILHGKHNLVLSDSNSNSCIMEACELKRDIQKYSSPPDASETGIYCRQMIFRMGIEEPKPTLS
jgi:hypothetical protein